MALNQEHQDPLLPLEGCPAAGPSLAGAPPALAVGPCARIKALLMGASARKGALAITDQLVFGAATFATSILIARAAGAGELGVYTLGISFLAIGLDLQNSLVLIPYTVFNPQRCTEEDGGRLESSALLHTLLLGLIAMALVGGLAISGALGLGSTAAGVALALAAPTLFMRQHARMICFAQLQIGRALLLDIAVGGLQIGLLLLLAATRQLHSAVLAYGVIALACGAGFTLWLALRPSLPRLKPRQAWFDFCASWRFSRWLVFTTPVGILRTQLPLWLLTYAQGTHRTGLFAACVSITALANPFLTGVNNFIGAKAAHIKAEGGAQPLRRFILQATGGIAAVMTIFALTLHFGGGLLVTTIYGPDYAGLGGIIAILGGAVLVNSISGPAFRGLLALQRSDITLSTEALMCIVQVTIGVWLVMRWGLAGAALAVFASNFAGAVYQFAIFVLHRETADSAQEGA